MIQQKSTLKKVLKSASHRNTNQMQLLKLTMLAFVSILPQITMEPEKGALCTLTSLQRGPHGAAWGGYLGQRVGPLEWPQELAPSC